MKKFLFLVVMLFAINSFAQQDRSIKYLVNFYNGAHSGSVEEFNENLQYFTAALDAKEVTPEKLTKDQWKMFTRGLYMGLVKGLEAPGFDGKKVINFLQYNLKNHPENLYSIANIYVNGLGGVEKDPKLALEYVNKSIAAKDIEAIVLLGFLYDQGFGVEKNEKKAFELVAEAAKKGSIKGFTNMGRYYYKGIGVEKDLKKALSAYENAAKLGSLESMFQSGFMYSRGIGTTKDLRKSFDYYNKCSSLGFLPCMTSLAMSYQEGLGVQKDNEQSFFWYKKAADRLDENAMINVAFMYEKGVGVSQNQSKAVEYYTKAANRGVVMGMEMLGGLYADVGDFERSRNWYEIAAASNSTASMVFLGYMYEKGIGTSQNYSKAIDWYKKAIKLNDSEGRTRLANLYLQGKGVEKNTSEAKKLLEDACKYTNKEACEFLKILK